MAVRVLNRFPCANVRVLGIRAEGGDPEITFTADPQGGTEALWFNFRVDDPSPPAAPPATLTLTLRFFENLLGGNQPSAVRPVTREAGKNWFRLKAPSVTQLPDGQQSLSWTLPYPSAVTEIALCYPYYRDELSLLLEHCKDYWVEESIGLTQEGRVLTRLRNDIAAGCPACENPHGLYVLARQHAGETPGGWVLDGLLAAFARAKPVNWCVWAVPFANLDGVANGDYGKDPHPYDLNRAWGNPPMRHETLVLKKDMERWAKRCRPALVLDLHAPGACEDAGVYAFLSDGTPELAKATGAWANVLKQSLQPEYAADDFSRSGNYPSRWETPRACGFAQERFGCSALSLETPYALCRDTVMTPKQYREVGQRIARAVITRKLGGSAG